MSYFKCMLKNCFLVLVFSFWAFLTYAQEKKNLYSQKLTISDGLAHNGITSMCQDSRGFLWFGTYNGLSKYDGYEFKTYKNSVDKNILTNNRIRALAEDENGNLLIGTEEGLTSYNFSSEKFTKRYSNKRRENGASDPIILKILVDKENDMVLCGTENNGVLIFKSDFSFLGKYIPSEQDFFKIPTFQDGVKLDDSNYLFNTLSGLLLFNINNKSFEHVLDKNVKNSGSVIKLDSSTLLVTFGRGVAVLDYDLTKQTNKITVRNKILGTHNFKQMVLDKTSGVLWLGELNEGVFQVDNINSVLTNKPFHVSQFKDNLIRLRASSFMLTKNNCWFGTFNKGVYKFEKRKKPFKNYHVGMNYDFGLASNSISHIVSMDNHRVYVSATQGGLALFNTKAGKFEPLPFKLPKGDELRVGGVYVDSKKNTWIYLSSDKSIIYRVKKGTTYLEKIPLELNLKNMRVKTFSEDTYGNVWIAATNKVYRISLDTSNNIKKVESLNNNPFFRKNKIAKFRKVYADPSSDFIWIGTDSNGLFRISNDNNSAIENLEIENFVYAKKNKRSIPSNFVSSIIRTPDSSLWIGTEGGGICKVLKSDTFPEFIPFTENEGLSNDVVKNILSDEENNLWITTNIGLNKFDTKTLRFRKFNKSDGLPFEDFSFAGDKLSNGTFILSGLDGFCYFKPRNVNQVEKLPEIHFENLKISGNTINPGDTLNNRVLLKKTISSLNEITLNHNENVFSLDITSLHYSNPKNHFIKYKLSPINSDWILAPSDQKTINYNGFRAGEYELKVMVSNSLNNWTSPKTLKIIVKPSIWKTNLAYTIYTFFALLFIYIVIRVILRIQALKHDVAIEQLEINSVKEANESKLRYFSNISHEIKTPLTLISESVGILFERFKSNPEIGEKLGLALRQSKKIKQLVEQVHDFRRADVNALKMNYSRFSFNTFINEFIEDFKFFAKNDLKIMEITGENSEVIVSADKDKLEKIFNNLINNAFKYTQSGDRITIAYKVVDKDLIVAITDTGRGIDKEDLVHVFERFYQSRKKENVHASGSGIGLAFAKRLVEMHYGFIVAESEINEGTTVTVRLPIVKELLENDVLEEIVLPKEKEILIDNHFFKENTLANIKASGDFSDSLIFYAEDNAEMRNFVTDLLSKLFKVKSFRNGQECLDALEDEWPEIVISDVQMPELNGLDLCVRIKSDLKTSHIPVILLTALANIENHLEGLRDGADAYIKKPFNLEHLVAEVEALLTNRKNLRERYQIGIPLTRESNKNSRNDNAFLDKLYSLIEESLYDQDFDFNKLSRELCLNRSLFYKKVKELTNQTPFEILKNYRLKKATELLVHEELTVNEVFVAVGFKNRAHFAKIFKEKYGTSPGKYAAELRFKHS